MLCLGVMSGLMPATVSAQEDARAIRIQWAPVPRARGYQVQLREEGGRNLFDRRVARTLFEPRLKPGTYLYRIAAVGKNNKPGQFSQWIRVNVRPTRTPEIGRVTPREDTARGTRVEVKGQGFQAESKAFLVDSNTGGRVELTTELIDENTMSVYVSAALLNDGHHDIVVENPRGLQKERSKAIEVAGGRVSSGPGARKSGGGFFSRKSDPDEPGEVVPPPGPSERGQALWRSALLPGLGQMYQGRTVTGSLVLGSQLGLWRSFNSRESIARTTNASSVRLVQRNAYLAFFSLSTVDQRDDFYLWRRFGAVREARFDRTVAGTNAAVGGALASAFYLWNLTDVGLYSGSGANRVGLSGALWRSAVLPGWGQYASGRPIAGSLYSSAFFLGATGALAREAGLDALREVQAGNNAERYWTANFTTARGGPGNAQPLFLYNEAVIERRRMTIQKAEARALAAFTSIVYAANIGDHFVPWGALGGGASAGLYIGPSADGPALGLSLRF